MGRRSKNLDILGSGILRIHIFPSAQYLWNRPKGSEIRHHTRARATTFSTLSSRLLWECAMLVSVA